MREWGESSLAAYQREWGCGGRKRLQSLDSTKKGNANGAGCKGQRIFKGLRFSAVRGETFNTNFRHPASKAGEVKPPRQRWMEREGILKASVGETERGALISLKRRRGLREWGGYNQKHLQDVKIGHTVRKRSLCKEGAGSSKLRKKWMFRLS